MAEYDEHDSPGLHKAVLSEAQESYVRGGRAADLRPRADSSPESRRPRPYPSPQQRPRRMSSAVAAPGEPAAPAAASAPAPVKTEEPGACDVPGCKCTGGRAPGTTRLRPAFQDSHPAWTVLEDDSDGADA